MEKSRAIQLHGKNPMYGARVYKYINGKVPVVKTDVWMSAEDTDQITTYYFNDEKLIKVTTNIPAVDSFKRYEQNIYFEGEKVIAKNSTDNEPFQTDYYVKRANEFIRNIKRKPLRFAL